MLCADVCRLLWLDDVELCRWASFWFTLPELVLVGCDALLVLVLCGCDAVLVGCADEGGWAAVDDGWLNPEEEACETEPWPRKSPPKPPRLKLPDPPPWNPPPPPLKPPRASAGASDTARQTATISVAATMGNRLRVCVLNIWFFLLI
jgi:hypothetical protein